MDWVGEGRREIVIVARDARAWWTLGCLNFILCVCVCACVLVSILVVCFLSFPFLSFTCVLINFYKHQ